MVHRDSRFRATLVRDPTGVSLRIEGEVDATAASQIQAKLAPCVAETVLVDLRACEFIDSGGLAALLRVDARLRQQGGKILLFGASRWVQRVLEINGLTRNGQFVELIAV